MSHTQDPLTNPFRVIDYVLEELRLLAINARVGGGDVFDRINPTMVSWDRAHIDARSRAEFCSLPFASYDDALRSSQYVADQLVQVAAGNETAEFSESDTLPIALSDRLEELAMAIDEKAPIVTPSPFDLPKANESTVEDLLRWLQESDKKNRLAFEARATRQRKLEAQFPTALRIKAPYLVTEQAREAWGGCVQIDEMEGETKADTPPIPADISKKGNGKGKDINAQMLAVLQAVPESNGWSIRKWASRLECSISTVAETKTWENLKTMKALQAAESVRRMDRSKTKSTRSKHRSCKPD